MDDLFLSNIFVLFLLKCMKDVHVLDQSKTIFLKYILSHKIKILNNCGELNYLKNNQSNFKKRGGINQKQAGEAAQRTY